MVGIPKVRFGNPRRPGCDQFFRSSAYPPSRSLLTDGAAAAGDRQQPDNASQRSNQLGAVGQVLGLDRLL